MFSGKATSQRNNIAEVKPVSGSLSGQVKTLPAVPVFQRKSGHGDFYALPAVKPFTQLNAVPITQPEIKQSATVSNNVAQLAPFSQPSSDDDEVLGKKCYAYTVFNALARVGRTPEIDGVAMTAEQVNDWIRENEAGSMGGGPQTVAKKMNDSFGFMKVGKSHRVAVRTALANHLPVSIGVVIGAVPEGEDKRPRHWIYGTGTTATEILAEDQQNEQRGILRFTQQGGVWVRSGAGLKRYEITKIEIGHDREAPEEYAAISRFF